MTTEEKFRKITNDAIKQWVIVKIRSGHHLKLQKNDILVLEADGNYTNIHTIRGKYCITCRIGTFVKDLSYAALVKVHKSYVINIDKIESWQGRRLFMNNMEIPISKSFQTLLKQALIR